MLKITPNEFLSQMSSKLASNMKFAFCSALIVSLLTHLYFFMGKFSNHDDVIYYYRGSLMVASGRIFFIIPSSVSSFFDIPWVLGTISILYISIAVMLLVDLLDIHNKLNIFIAVASIITFPSLCTTFSYLFTADVYSVALLFSVFAVWLTKKFKYGFIPGAAALCFSLGLYQAYIAYTMTISAILLIIILLKNEKSIKEFFVTAARYLLMGVGGGISYFILVKAAVAITGIELLSYQGIDAMGRFRVRGVITGIAMAYKGFLGFFIRDEFLYKSMFLSALYILMLALVIIGATGILFLNRYSVATKAMTLVLLFLLPVCVGAIYVLAPSGSYHLLMFPAYALVPVLLVSMLEFAQIPGYVKVTKSTVFSIWMGTLCCICIIFNWYMRTNIGYLNMHMRYEKTYGLALRILDRAEQQPGYTQKMNIVVMGSLGEEYNTQLKGEQGYLPPISDILKDMTGMQGDYVLHGNPKLWMLFMHDYLGKNFNALDYDYDQIVASIEKREEYDDMPIWPASESVRIIDDVVVVKFS